MMNLPSQNSEHADLLLRTSSNAKPYSSATHQPRTHEPVTSCVTSTIYHFSHLVLIHVFYNGYPAKVISKVEFPLGWFQPTATSRASVPLKPPCLSTSLVNIITYRNISAGADLAVRQRAVHAGTLIDRRSCGKRFPVHRETLTEGVQIKRARWHRHNLYVGRACMQRPVSKVILR